MDKFTPEQTAEAIGYSIERLQKVLDAKIEYGQHLAGPTMRAARTHAERDVTSSMIQTNLTEIKFFTDLIAGLTIIKERQ